VEKRLPTFQLHGSIITASFHIAELVVMSQFIVDSIVFDRYMSINKPYFFWPICAKILLRMVFTRGFTFYFVLVVLVVLVVVRIDVSQIKVF
jgi:hypothetical protein